MKIKLLVSRAGIGFSQNAGEVVEVDEKEAARMIAKGQAEEIAKKETRPRKTKTETTSK